MTISTQTSTITYQGNGITTVWTFPFVADDEDFLTVTYTDGDGNETVLVPSQYTVVLNPIPVGGLWSIGGSVTYPNVMSPTPIQNGTFITITREVPYLQTVSVANQGAFYPQAVEQALDLLELQIQQLQTLSIYAIRAPFTDIIPPNPLPPAAERANGYLGFDNNGQPIIFTTAPSPSSLTFATPRKVTVSGVNTVNVQTTDSFGGVSIYQASGSTTTVQLPSGYGPFPIFDGGLNAQSYPIKILPPGGSTILGMTQYFLSFNGQSATFYNDGSQILIG